MLSLSVATEAEARARDLVTYPAWGAGLTVDAYVERERTLRSHRWARTAMTTWLLRANDGDVLASCETFRGELNTHGSATSISGGAYAVASVFTEEPKREHGYATTMMRLLPAALRDADASAKAIYLFSDIGTALYERVGYLARASVEYASDATYHAQVGPPDELLSDTSEHALSLFPPPSEGVVVWPSADRLDWHWERARYYTKTLGRAPLASYGARAGQAALVWSNDLKNDRLVVLLARPGTPDDTARVFAAARRVAADAHLTEVVGWSEPHLVPPAGFDFRVRKGAIPMMLALGDDVDVERWQHIPRALWV